MTFEDARKELSELAHGRYHAIYYELTIFKNERVEPKCTVYVDGLKHFSAPNWRGCLDKLRVACEKFEIDSKEAPTLDDTISAEYRISDITGKFPGKNLGD